MSQETTANTPLTQTIYCQGGLLTEGLLTRMRGLIEGRDVGLPLEPLHLRPDDYDRSAGDTLREQALRSWERLQRAWASLKERSEEELTLAITQQRWLRPLFEELGFGPPQPVPSGGFVIGGRRYPISHLYGEHVPIHLLPWDTALDRRTRALKGAARSTPHSMMQEFLNRSQAHLWGILCNGVTLRLLRDNDSLTQLAYIEFDLAQILEEGRWPDFFSMWLTCHRSRFEPASAGRPESCVMERWMAQSRSEGVLALNALRDSVIKALEQLSRGFTRATPALRDAIKPDALHAQLLRVVYRLIFLCVTEERDALLLPALDPAADRDAYERRARARDHYERFYSLRAMRRDAIRGEARQDNPHNDLWLRLLAVADGLSRGHERLALPAINSFLWSNAEALPDLKGAACRNDELLGALWSLDHFTHNKRTERINWRDISAAELGSVYEALLELHPSWAASGEGLDYGISAAGSERKTTGSYYTPVELVEALCDSALTPLLTRTQTLPRDKREAALLDLKVCDPSCGSGHFLIAAARRIGHELASARSGELAPSPEEQRLAIRDVVARCLYGVDSNRMAVELCKVALWMEAMVPGLPLPYLEHHIQHGNALLGATPELLKRGLPEEAITTLEGDDNKVTNAIRSAHRKQVASAAQVTLGQWSRGMIEALTTQAGAVEALGDATLRAIEDKDVAWKAYLDSPQYKRARRHADLWCAAFVWRRTATSLPSPTHDTLLQDPLNLPSAMQKEVERLRDRYGFFHWHLQFPQVFRAQDDGATPGGFDLVLGNPPWETVELKDNEFFAKYQTPEAKAIVAAKKSADTKKLIDELQSIDPDLHARYLDEKRYMDGFRHILGQSGRYPLTGQGRINTYAVFSEHNRDIIAPTGRAAFIVPSGIATDDNTKEYFQAVTEARQLAALYHFENEDRLFPAVHHAYRFCIVSLCGPQEATAAVDIACYMRRVDEIHSEEKRYTLSVDDIRAINPNTGTLPAFRWARDAEITKKIHKHIPILMREGEQQHNPWGLYLKQGLFNMASDSGLFQDASQLKKDGWTREGNVWSKDDARALPLWEAKMVHHFDHRFGTYEGQTEAQARQGTLPRPTPEQKADPRFVTLPKYWVEELEIKKVIPDDYDREWLLGWRDIVRATDFRTLIPSIIPRAACGDTLLLAFISSTHIKKSGCLLANLTSLIADYSARQRVGGTHLKFYTFKQIPVLPPEAYDRPCQWSYGETLGEWVGQRAVELVYTSEELRGFARDCGYMGEPYVWEEGRRRELRAELDGAFFHLYGLKRDEVVWVLGTFHLIDEEIKAGVLAAYDAQQRARDEQYMPRVAAMKRTVELVQSFTAPPETPAPEATPVARAPEAPTRLYEVIGRLAVEGFGVPAIAGTRATWQLGGWAVEVDFTGPEKARAKALHAEQEEERGRAFVLSAPDLAEQVATFLRGLGA